MGRVLGIEGIELVGINNRSLGNAAFVHIDSSDISCLRTSSRGCESCYGQVQLRSLTNLNCWCFRNI